MANASTNLEGASKQSKTRTASRKGFAEWAYGGTVAQWQQLLGAPCCHALELRHGLSTPPKLPKCLRTNALHEQSTLQAQDERLLLRAPCVARCLEYHSCTFQEYECTQRCD